MARKLSGISTAPENSGRDGVFASHPVRGSSHAFRPFAAGYRKAAGASGPRMALEWLAANIGSLMREAQWRKLLPFLRKVMSGEGWSAPPADSAAKASILFFAGVCALEMCVKSESLGSLAMSREMARRIGPTAGLIAADAMEAIGRVHSFFAEYEKALECYSMARGEFERTGGDAGVRIAMTTIESGNVHYFMGNYREASRMYGEALTSCGSDRLTLARIDNDNGVVATKKGDFSSALELLERALETRARLLGPGHPLVASTLNNIGDLYLDMERYDDALESFFAALEIRKAIYGITHPYSATTLNDIGDVHLDRGDYREALSYYRRSEKGRLLHFGPDHPALATSHNNIGLVYSNLGIYRKARERFEMSLDIKRRFFGPDHPYVAITYHNIGSSLMDSGDEAGAVEFFEKALAIDGRSASGMKPRTIETLNHIAKLKADLGDFAAAVSFYREVISMIDGNQELSSIYMHETLSGLGRVYMACGDHDSARECMTKALSLCEKAFGIDAPPTARAAFDLGELELRRGEPELAVPFFKRAAETPAGPSRPMADAGESFARYFLLGLLKFGARDFIGSLAEFEAALETERKECGEDPELAEYSGIASEFVRMIKRRYL